jgi:acetyl-CoA carboxylase biotin carboxyl carrier protein
MVFAIEPGIYLPDKGGARIEDMNLKEVKELVAEILRSDIMEFELEHTGTRIRLRRGSQSVEAAPAASAGATMPERAAPENAQAGEIAEAPSSAPKEGPDSSRNAIHIITSPIVGTFYRAPSPGAAPYVKIGDVVEEGTVLCVVEAMKLMNEIICDAAGEVVRIFVENSHPVEFGQELFGIRPRK